LPKSLIALEISGGNFVLDLLLNGRPRLFLDGCPDVAAAYSGRRLVRRYSGPLVRVRRASDNAEADFGVGHGGVDWGAIASFIGAGSGFVSKWYDQSGNGRDAAQSTASAQPGLALLAAGKPAVVFDGVDDQLVTASFTVNQPVSFNISARWIAAANLNYSNLFDGLTVDHNAFARATSSSNVNKAFMFGGSNFLFSNANDITVGARFAAGGCFQGASSILEINATTTASFTGPPDFGTNATNGLTIGSVGAGDTGRAANAEIQELILFNTAHLPAGLKADNAALRAFWG
jgi:hypothetical protein